MAKLTRANVAYDLNISPHRLTISYSQDDITYVFSSELYRNKFLAAIHENRNKINHSLSNRFGFTIRNELLCDIKLYTSIEKRGFLIIKGQDKVECLNQVELVGQTVKMPNLEKP